MSELLLGHSRARLDDRQVTELVGISRGVLADGHLNDKEIEFLQKWVAASAGVIDNPVLSNLAERIEDVLRDGMVDEDERSSLVDFLQDLCRNDFELGEVLKSTSLPLCSPTPLISFENKRFTFTGTFVIGSRRECEAAAVERGADAGSLTKQTDFLVIGECATESWMHSTFGRKIEKAVRMRASGAPIHIVSEVLWRSAL